MASQDGSKSDHGDIDASKSEAQMHALRADGLGKRYYLNRKMTRELWALKAVDFDAVQGEILGIIGANGAGKTTLLKILARVTMPTEGRVEGRGRILPLLSLKAGFEPRMTTRENIYLNAAMRGISTAIIDRQFDEIVSFADISDHLEDPLKSCPNGMYLRLAFSMIVALDPEIILADEVLAVGDVEFQEACLARVAEACQRGAAVLYVSHNMSEIRSIAHRVMWIDKGRVRAIGDPEKIVSEYEDAALSLAGYHEAVRKKNSQNRYGALLFAKLHRPDGTVARAIRTSEDAVLTMTFRLEHEDVVARCAFDFHTSSFPAFRATCPDVVGTVGSGVYSASLMIPPRLLSNTLYNIDAHLVIEDARGQAHPLSQKRVVTFQVHDPDETAQINVALRPDLEWSVTGEATA